MTEKRSGTPVSLPPETSSGEHTAGIVQALERAAKGIFNKNQLPQHDFALLSQGQKEIIGAINEENFSTIFDSFEWTINAFHRSQRPDEFGAQSEELTQETSQLYTIVSRAMLESMPVVESFLTAHPEFAQKAISTYANLFSSAKEESVRTLLEDYIIHNLAKVVRFTERSDVQQEVKDAQYIVSRLYRYGTNNTQQKLHDHVDMLCASDNEEIRMTGRNLLGFVAQEHLSTKGLFDREYPILEEKMVKTLDSYGLSGEDLLLLWENNQEYKRNITIPTPDRQNEWVLQNFLSVNILEQSTPGICKVLREEFGIRNFARYPIGILRQQYLERTNTNLAYGVHILAVDDHNGSFSTQETNMILANATGQYNHGVRYIEIDGKIELAKRLLTLDKKYGKKHKIAYAVLGGHGSNTRIYLGDNDRANDILTIEDFSGRTALRLAEVFMPGATIILEACSTAKEEEGQIPIAQRLSKFGFEVIASDRNGWLTQLVVERDEKGRFIFDAVYASKKPFRIFRGTRYKNGEKVA